MPPLFTKFHGFGNDYIVIEAKALALMGVAESAALSEFAQRICNRHYGAGADGIAVVGPSTSADFHVRIFNPDGSEASLSGNGTRCAASFLYYKQHWAAPELRLSTRSGNKLYTLKESDGRGSYVFDSELGEPKFDPASIPMITAGPRDTVVDYQLNFDDESITVTALQMGNPNCCIFVDDFESLDWRRIGKRLENHEQFPERTNVIFVRVEDRQNIELRIWERGVGETEASGTCSCAAAVAGMVKNKTDRLVNVRMPGGNAKIQWRGAGLTGEVVITGTAAVIYDGDWLVNG
ncbi:MAG TPA: diaminopimelate epimerase [Pyrinomonadaceae bacterium]|nr:diaminopimelate epimerase [Pyrinomonadaceae bacterium]